MPDAASAATFLPDGDCLRALGARRTRARDDQDMAALEALHAPGYELITPAGRVLAREVYLSAPRAAPFCTGWEVGAMSVRIAARMAVFRYPALLRFPSGRELRCWHTDSYALGARGWQAVWSQATALADSGPNPGARSPA